MSDERFEHIEEPELTPRQVGGWLEFCCWTTLVLAPFLYWANGPAVSTDQFVVRTSLVAMAAVGVAGFRTYSWLNR